jgi:CheY-like chemotaxis protein
MPARILVAEDDDGVRSLVGTALHRAGYKVDFAAHGNEAIEALGANPDYDAIILDLMMPYASGFEVLAWLHRAKKDMGRRRVIVLTAMAEKDLTHLTPDRVYDVIRKPFDLNHLLTTIAECIAATRKAEGPEGGKAEEAGS